MSAIKYKDGMDLRLVVKDIGLIGGYLLYFDGDLIDESAGERRSYTIAKPEGTVAIVIHFNDEDGGSSGIFDLADDNKRLDRQSGTRHSYLVSADDDKAFDLRPSKSRSIVMGIEDSTPKRLGADPGRGAADPRPASAMK